MKTIICMILWFLPTILSAQSADALQTEAMNKLDWFIGEWQGEAWTKMGPANPEKLFITPLLKFLMMRKHRSLDGRPGVYQAATSINPNLSSHKMGFRGV